MSLEEHIAKEYRKLEEFREYPGEYDDAMKEEITKQIDALNDELTTRQESIDLLKGRLKNQITSCGGSSPKSDWVPDDPLTMTKECSEWQSREENFLGPSRGVWGHGPPENFEK